MFESDDVLLLNPDPFSWEICSLLYIICDRRTLQVTSILDGNLERSKFIFDVFEGWK
jgi:hypothetical protein